MIYTYLSIRFVPRNSPGYVRDDVFLARVMIVNVYTMTKRYSILQEEIFR